MRSVAPLVSFRQTHDTAEIVACSCDAGSTAVDLECSSRRVSSPLASAGVDGFQKDHLLSSVDHTFSRARLLASTFYIRFEFGV